MLEVSEAALQGNDLKTQYTIKQNLTVNILKIKDQQGAVIRTEHGVIGRWK